MFSFILKRMLQDSTQHNVFVLSEKPGLFELLLSRLEHGNQDCNLFSKFSIFAASFFIAKSNNPRNPPQKKMSMKLRIRIV
jgi:hypothetical protein